MLAVQTVEKLATRVGVTSRTGSGKSCRVRFPSIPLPSDLTSYPYKTSGLVHIIARTARFVLYEGCFGKSLAQRRGGFGPVIPHCETCDSCAALKYLYGRPIYSTPGKAMPDPSRVRLGRCGRIHSFALVLALVLRLHVLGELHNQPRLRPRLHERLEHAKEARAVSSDTGNSSRGHNRIFPFSISQVATMPSSPLLSHKNS